MFGRGSPDILNNNYRRERAFCHRRPLRGQGEGMKLKTRVKLTVFFLVALVVVLNTGIITAYISGSLKENAVQSIQSVNQQTLITFDNLLDSFGTMSQLPLMDREIYEILNKDYEKDYEDKVRRFYLYRDMDTIDGKLYAEMFYRNEYVYSVTLIPFNADVVYSKQRFCKTARDRKSVV